MTHETEKYGIQNHDGTGFSVPFSPLAVAVALVPHVFVCITGGPRHHAPRCSQRLATAFLMHLHFLFSDGLETVYTVLIIGLSSQINILLTDAKKNIFQNRWLLLRKKKLKKTEFYYI
jgi:hypothetical protein